MALITAEINRTDMKHIIEKLDRLDVKAQDSAVKRGLIEAGKVIEREVKLNISGRILRVRTNRLRASIGSKVTINSGGGNG
jgi:hypothetical protein